MAQSSYRWNHNTLYHPVILDAIPPGCRRALDVGCGEGTLTRELRRLIPEVTGIDSDNTSNGSLCHRRIMKPPLGRQSGR